MGCEDLRISHKNEFWFAIYTSDRSDLKCLCIIEHNLLAFYETDDLGSAFANAQIVSPSMVQFPSRRIFIE